MILKLIAAALAGLLVIVLLIGASAGAVAEALLDPFAGSDTTTASTQGTSTQLDAAQYCALGKITPGKATSYGTFTATQIANATTIYQVALSLDLPAYAAVVAIATAIQESDLYNLDYGDRDSLGLFQQRPSQGWGTPAEILDPTYAATKFYQALVKVPNWQSIPLTEAAQDVQESAYPDAYAAHSEAAAYLVATISGALDDCTTK